MKKLLKELMSFFKGLRTKRQRQTKSIENCLSSQILSKPMKSSMDLPSVNKYLNEDGKTKLWKEIGKENREWITEYYLKRFGYHALIPMNSKDWNERFSLHVIFGRENISGEGKQIFQTEKNISKESMERLEYLYVILLEQQDENLKPFLENLKNVILYGKIF